LSSPLDILSISRIEIDDSAVPKDTGFFDSCPRAFEVFDELPITLARLLSLALAILMSRATPLNLELTLMTFYAWMMMMMMMMMP